MKAEVKRRAVSSTDISTSQSIIKILKKSDLKTCFADSAFRVQEFLQLQVAFGPSVHGEGTQDFETAHSAGAP